MKRRELLKGSILMGAGGLLTGACGPAAEQVIPILVPEERFVPGVEQWLATTCCECAGGCGLLARKIDGRIVKIEGNPDHPISRGGTCAKGQALPQALYHPDRLRSPVAREGQRGEGRWREITWDDAFAQLTSELGRLEQESIQHQLVFLTGELRGHRRDLVQRFLEAFGSPHHLIHEPFGESAIRHAHGLSSGINSFFAHDLENANYVVSFGAGLVETSRSPVRFGRGLAHMRRGRPGRRGKLVAVEPRMSVTGASADEWIPARPGSEASVALALVNVLIREGLFDEAFIQNQTSAFESLRELVRSQFDPERVARAADIPVATIARIAREMAAHRPALAIAGDAAVSGPQGLATASAVSHLNALLGSFGVEGGIFFDPDPPFAPWPEFHERTAAQPQSLAAAIEQNQFEQGEIAVLFVSGTNPAYSLPASFRVEEALSNVPFVVSFATFIDETTDMADLVLPEPTSFERFEDDVPSPGVGQPLASVSAPVLAAPLYETRSMPDVLIQLSSQLEGSLAAAFPWESYEQALRAAWVGLGETHRGSIAEAWEPETFWQEALRRGGWWDETYTPTADFGTADGRYRFDIGPFEAMATAPINSEEFPLHLHIYPSAAFGDGRSAHLPFLQELSDPMTGVRWGTVVELNPKLAESLGVKQGQLVEVSSAYGRLHAPAHLSPTVRPDIVAVAAGQGHTHYGRFATGKGQNAFQLLAPELAPLSLAPVMTETAVRLRAK